MSGKGSLRRGTDRQADQRYAEGWARIFGAPSAKPVPKRVKKAVKPYPAWTCSDCATKAGGVIRDEQCATWHTGDCEVCGITQWVTQPRDYGYPKYK